MNVLGELNGRKSKATSSLVLEIAFVVVVLFYMTWVPVTYEVMYIPFVSEQSLLFHSRAKKRGKVVNLPWNSFESTKGHYKILDSNHFELKLKPTKWLRRQNWLWKICRKEQYVPVRYYLYERKKDIAGWFSKKG
jgi:hypothetical protein